MKPKNQMFELTEINDDSYESYDDSYEEQELGPFESLPTEIHYLLSEYLNDETLNRTSQLSRYFNAVTEDEMGSRYSQNSVFFKSREILRQYMPQNKGFWSSITKVHSKAVKNTLAQMTKDMTIGDVVDTLEYQLKSRGNPIDTNGEMYKTLRKLYIYECSTSEEFGGNEEFDIVNTVQDKLNNIVDDCRPQEPDFNAHHHVWLYR